MRHNQQKIFISKGIKIYLPVQMPKEKVAIYICIYIAQTVYNKLQISVHWSPNIAKKIITAFSLVSERICEFSRECFVFSIFDANGLDLRANLGRFYFKKVCTVSLNEFPKVLTVNDFHGFPPFPLFLNGPQFHRSMLTYRR